MSPFFLTIEQVLALHERMVRDFGGSPLIRDHGLLESAISLPAATYMGEFLHDGIPAMAGAYLFHLCQNHPFLDGNKRTALAAAELFLELNNFWLAADNETLEKVTRAVAEGELSKADVASFLERVAKAT